MSRNAWFAMAVAVVCGSSAVAEDPVTFDSRNVFPCTEIKPPKGADLNRKVVVISIPISANFNVPDASVEKLRIEVRLPETMKVIDYLPKTRTAAEIAAQREQRIDDRHNVVNVEFGDEAKLEAKLEVNALVAGLNTGATNQRRDEEFKQIKTEILVDKLPSQKQVIVAGSMNEGQTRYFEFPSHTQVTRAGESAYVVLAEVAKDWTGDVAILIGAAKQGDTLLPGAMSKAVGLYLNGDLTAEKRVRDQLRTVTPPKLAIAPPKPPEPQPTPVVGEKIKPGAAVLKTSIGLVMNRISSGSFPMGARPDETDNDGLGILPNEERPQHIVTITKPFFIGVHEVTQKQYKELMGSNPSSYQYSDEMPVENVSWFDAVRFCNRLSEREGRKPYYRIEGNEVSVLGGNGFRLPTEAEWEYACRAGSVSKFCSGDFERDLDAYAWYSGNSGSRPHPVGGKKPNQFGLFDMHGNVWEWTGDWYSEAWYKSPQTVDPAGPPSATYRVFRGGSWFNAAAFCRSAPRGRNSPVDRGNGLGFRVAAVQD